MKWLNLISVYIVLEIEYACYAPHLPHVEDVLWFVGSVVGVQH